MRPTLHRISESGVLPFSSSFSTVGVFANKLTVLEQVMNVLLASDKVEQSPITTIYLLEDSFALADQEINEALENSITKLKTWEI